MVKIIHAPIVQSSFSGDHCLGGNAITRGQLSWEAIVLGAICPGDPFVSVAIVRAQLSADNYPGVLSGGGQLSWGASARGSNYPGAIVLEQLPYCL